MRQQDFEQLVSAVLATDAVNESVWLEWKSELDLSGQRGRAHLARCVIGFANRMPDVAAPYCEGQALIVVGAAPETGVKGIAELDPVVLDSYLKPFLGADGPRWAPHWVHRDGKPVLVLQVAAPRAGDPIHVAQREGDKIEDGGIYVRRPGSTERATSAEIRGLQHRQTAGDVRSRRLDGLAVAVCGGIHVLDLSEESIEEWIESERQRYLRPLEAWEPPPPADGARELVPVIMDVDKALREVRRVVTLESRTPEKYLEEVESHLDLARGRVAGVCLALAPFRLPAAVLQVENTTDRRFDSVEVVLLVPENVHGYAPRPPEANEPWPRGAPRVWGQRDRVLSIDPTEAVRSAQASLFAAADQVHAPEIRNGGSLQITTAPTSFRPFGRDDSTEVVLLTNELLAGPVLAEWSATASIDGRLTGTVEIPVVQTLRVVDVMQRREE
jgi:hypothetical protein